MEDTSFNPPPPGPPAEPPFPPPPTPPSTQVIPWEEPARPWFPALLETARLFLTEPRKAYERVPVRGDVLRPLVFALILGWVGVAATGVYTLLFGDMQMNMMQAQRPDMANMPDFRAINRISAFVYIFLGPVLIACGLLVSSALTHVSLAILGGAKQGFSATVRAMCYAYAPSFLGALPFCGGLIGGVWTLVLAVIGISTLHSTTIGKAVLAILLPGILICCCVMGAAGVAGMFAGMQEASP